ncbi:lamin tail domain-containing protein [Actinocorallia populi]|uniref:lamin tail domain-containing protein n=1 Tax=Actinocorallia populi TaxID=2079200 RepID=UPI000D08C3CE|nr:lamin tail domain-containing protein [Actinocorallia populi]
MNTVPFLATAFLVIGVLAPEKGASTPDSAPDVRIERVRFDAPGTDARTNRSLNGEWVEVRNRSRQARNLRGWRLQGADGRTYTFGDLRLPPGRSVRVHTGSGRDTGGHVYWNRGTHAWRNSGSAVRLRSPAGSADSCRWRSGGTVKRC